MARDDGLRRLFAVLRERAGDTVTEAEILRVTGGVVGTLNTYWSKGLFASLLDEDDEEGRYRVDGINGLPYNEFRRETTQSQYLGDVAHTVKAKLARALVKKSRDCRDQET
jgi:hypothetical protein